MQRLNFSQKAVRPQEKKPIYKRVKEWLTIPIAEPKEMLRKPSTQINISKERPQIIGKIQEIVKTSKVDEVFLFCIQDEKENAWIAHNNIYVTSKLLKSASDEQLLGIIAHEVGHLHLGHAKITDLEMKTASFHTQMMMSSIHKLVFGSLLEKIKGLQEFALSFCNKIIEEIHKNIGKRKEEYAADAFAVMVGHGQGLLEYMEKSWKEANLLLKVLMMVFPGTHPPLNRRIAKIKEMMNEMEEKKDEA